MEKEISEKGNRKAKQQKMDEKEWGSLEPSEKSGMLQKKRRIWKNTL